KVTGEKVFARDIRARDMPHWPRQQSHALVLRVSMADRSYAGFDLSALGSELAPDRAVTAADLARDGLAFPDFYGEDTLLPQGQTPAYLGQAVASWSITISPACASPRKSCSPTTRSFAMAP